MKKIYSTILLLAMMVAALGLTACGGDDDEIGGNSSFLIGTWSVTSGQGWGGYTGDGEANISNSNQMVLISMCSLMMGFTLPKELGEPQIRSL